jgi:hypothetical protein
MSENIVAIVDVDSSYLGRCKSMLTEKKGLEPRTYADYREMLVAEGDKIDAVVIGTSDHHHAPAAIRAIRAGKHVYCEKPLTHTIFESRLLAKAAAEKGVATQLGPQIHAENNYRRVVEIIKAGVLGNVTEVHVWVGKGWGGGDRPAKADPVPATLNWDLWLGPAQFRPYKKGVYHSFAWRGWNDFGTGALGDMACHTVNMPFRALKLGYPTRVVAELTSQSFPETFAKTSRLRFEFPERDGLPPLKFWWYDGNPTDKDLAPLRPSADLTREIVTLKGSLPSSGCLLVGDKGKLFSPDDYGSQFFIMVGNEKIFLPGDAHEAVKAVPQSIPRSPGHNEEWFQMMRNGTPAYSNFDIAAYLTEIILLGCIAVRVGEGKVMDWDGPNMRSTNLPEAARFVKRDSRKGWDI